MAANFAKAREIYQDFQWRGRLWYFPEFPLHLINAKDRSQDERKPRIAAMVEDLKKNPLRTPVSVSFVKSIPFMAIDGNHRIRCARILGWETIPAVGYGPTIPEELDKIEAVPIERLEDYYDTYRLLVLVHPNHGLHTATFSR